MKASDLFVKALENEGVEYIFGIPGEENLDLFRVNSVLSDARLTLTLSLRTQRSSPSNLAPSLDVNV